MLELSPQILLEKGQACEYSESCQILDEQNAFVEALRHEVSDLSQQIPEVDCEEFKRQKASPLSRQSAVHLAESETSMSTKGVVIYKNNYYLKVIIHS